MARDSHEIFLDVDDDDDDDVFAESYNQMIRKRRASRYHGGSGRRKNSRRRSSLAPDSEHVRRRSRSTSTRRGSALSVPDGDESDESEDDIGENLKLQREVIAGLKAQPWPMKRKLKTLRMAKGYVEKFEGQLSKSKGYQQNAVKAFRKFKREMSNLATQLLPWEQRIKSIESHFGSVVSSYFVFLRWVFWVNLVNAILFLGLIILPETLFGDKNQPRKTIPDNKQKTSLNLASIWAFEGYIQYSLMLFGYYSSDNLIIPPGFRYRLPLAYLLVTLATFGYCLITILRKMAANSRLSKMSMGDEQYVFCWKVFSSWDYMIGNAETANNKYAAIATTFRESILEAEEKAKEDESSKRVTLFLRILANILVLMVLSASCYAIVLVVQRSVALEARKREKPEMPVGWWDANEVSIVMSGITLSFPSIFDLIGMMERYHPRIYLRWQLARILVLYLMNLYTLVIALRQKVDDMTDEINSLRDKHQQQLKWYADNITVICATDPPAQENTTGPDIPLTTLAPNCTNTTLMPYPSEKPPNICWETMVGQEMYKLTVMDLVMTAGGILIIDFFRGVFVRYANQCWCWDLELKFPEYGEFKIAENILHLIYNQGMIWMGFFFAPALPALNIFKLLMMLYIRAWAVMMCNIPHERIFRASRSNNFYFALLLMMLFLCALPTGYCIVSIQPSPACGPFAGSTLMYNVLMQTIKEELPQWVTSLLDIIASPTVIIPIFILLIMTIYYLIAMVRSLKESNSDLKDQLQYERTEEKKKIYAMADAKANKAAGLDNQKDAILPPKEIHGEQKRNGVTKKPVHSGKADHVTDGMNNLLKHSDEKHRRHKAKSENHNASNATKESNKHAADGRTPKEAKGNMVKIITGNKEKLVSIDHLQQLAKHQNNMSPKHTPVAVVTGKQNVRQSQQNRRHDKKSKERTHDSGGRDAASRDRSRDHIITIRMSDDEDSDEVQQTRVKEINRRNRKDRPKNKDGAENAHAKNGSRTKHDRHSEHKHQKKTYPIPKTMHDVVIAAQRRQRQQAPPEIIITRGTSEASTEAEEERRRSARRERSKSRWKSLMQQTVSKSRTRIEPDEPTPGTSQDNLEEKDLEEVANDRQSRRHEERSRRERSKSRWKQLVQQTMDKSGTRMVQGASTRVTTRDNSEEEDQVEADNRRLRREEEGSRRERSKSRWKHLIQQTTKKGRSRMALDEQIPGTSQENLEEEGVDEVAEERKLPHQLEEEEGRRERSRSRWKRLLQQTKNKGRSKTEPSKQTHEIDKDNVEDLAEVAEDRRPRKQDESKRERSKSRWKRLMDHAINRGRKNMEWGAPTPGTSREHLEDEDLDEVARNRRSLADPRSIFDSEPDIRHTKSAITQMIKSRPRRQQSHRSLKKPEVAQAYMLNDESDYSEEEYSSDEFSDEEGHNMQDHNFLSIDDAYFSEDIWGQINTKAWMPPKRKTQDTGSESDASEEDPRTQQTDIESTDSEDAFMQIIRQNKLKKQKGRRASRKGRRS